MRTKYHILFSIEVLHNFFGSGRWSEVEFVPTSETAFLLKQNELSTRQIGNELLVITKVDNSGKILSDLHLLERFSFAIVPQSANYLNFSNILIAPLTSPVFNFHNLDENEMGGKHFISQKIKDYTGTHSYLPGDFVKAPDGHIYESIAKNDAGAGSIVPKTTAASKEAWVLHGDVQFVSAADTKTIFAGNEYDLELCTGVFSFKTSVAKTEHLISVYALRRESLKYDKEVLSAKTSFDIIHDQVPVDLSALPSGKYRIKVNEDIKFVYLIHEISYNALPIFVDIYNLPATSPQAIIDAAQKPARTKFTIAFAARRVLWRYNTRTSIIDKIEDTDGDIVFKTDGLKNFISKKPIPFSEGPRKTLVAKSGTLTITSQLPNPLADRLLDKKNDIYTTASFINY